jgi:hypothetical protein
MPRVLAVSIGARVCALGLVLLCATPAAADSVRLRAHKQARVDAKPKRVSTRSLRDFETCQKERAGTSSEACLDALKVYIKQHPKDAFEAGKLVRVHYMYWEALEFFAAQGSDPYTKKQCADRDLRAAVLAGLALPAHYPAVALAQGLVNGPCHKQLTSSVAAQLKRAGRVFRDNACSLVSEQVQATRCRPEPAALAEASEPVVLPEPRKAELMAKAPELREAPPARPEATATPPVHRLGDVFPARPEVKARRPRQAAVAELRTAD